MSQPEKEQNKVPENEALSAQNELERLKRDVYRSDEEKFRLFTQMLRANKLYKDAKVTHK